MVDEDDTAGRADAPAWPSAPAAGDASAPSGWAPVPPPKKSRAGLVIGLILGALVLVGVLVVGLVVLSSSGDGFPSDDEQALIRAIPGPVKTDDCTSLSTSSEAVVAAVSCRVGDGADLVTARKFAGVRDTNKGFAVDEAVVELADDTSDCIDRDKVEHDYDSNAGYSGRVLCYRKNGRSVIAWTHPEKGIVFTASRNDRRDVKLYRWWSAGIGRRYPTTDQVDALKELAPGSAKKCQSARPLRGSIAAIRCDGVGGVSLYFTQYASTQDMADQYVSFLGDAGLEQGQNAGTDTCPEEGAINARGETTGRVFCTYDGSGKAPRIVFTDEATDILAEVLGDDGEDGDQLLIQWGIGSYDPGA